EGQRRIESTEVVSDTPEGQRRIESTEVVSDTPEGQRRIEGTRGRVLHLSRDLGGRGAVPPLMHRALVRAVLVAVGSSGIAGAGPQPSVKVAVSVTPRLSTSTLHFVLRCHPTGGDLPFAAHVCGDIDRHPTAMLDPDAPRQLCEGLADEVSIWTSV